MVHQPKQRTVIAVDTRAAVPWLGRLLNDQPAEPVGLDHYGVPGPTFGPDHDRFAFNSLSGPDCRTLVSWESHGPAMCHSAALAWLNAGPRTAGRLVL